jgi:putative hemin transport protein
MDLETVVGSRQLIERWAEVRRREPKLGQREVAARLGVPEAELVAAHTGTNAVRLGTDWEGILRRLPAIGPATALTRSTHAVIEQQGTYADVRVEGGIARVDGGVLHLRALLSRWHVGFAVTWETPRGFQRSLQFFDADGVAIHKVLLSASSSDEEFDALADAFESANQEATEELPNSGMRTVSHEPLDATSVRAAWETLGRALDLQGWLDGMGVPRTQAFEVLDSRLAERVSRVSYRTVLREAACCSLPLEILVPNHAVAQSHQGRMDAVTEVDSWFNVLDPEFKLHLEARGIASVWIVRGLNRSGVGHHLELHDGDGSLAAGIFLHEAAQARDARRWQELLSGLEPPPDPIRICRDIAHAVASPAEARRRDL